VIAVTGANGYVGGRIIAHLRARGIDTVALVRRPDGNDPHAREYALGSALDPSLLEGIELVVHAAYDLSAVGAQQRTVNLQGSLPLLEGLAARGARMLLISSLSAFEGARSVYGRTKLELERAVLERGGIALRPGLIFGARAGDGSGPGGLFSSMVATLSKRALAPLIGGGAQRLFVTHDQRLCELVSALIARSPAPSGPLFAAHEVPTTLREIAAQIARVRGRRLRVIAIPPAPVYLGLRSAELAHLGLAFRSDSLRSLLNPVPLDQLAALQRSELHFPPLSPELWAEPQLDPEAQLER
jgi:nucleoside-diphosphate-sugar epimerase